MVEFQRRPYGSTKRMALRTITHARGNGARGGSNSVVAGPAISARARSKGYQSIEDLKLAVLKQRPTWWSGNSYHCPLCDIDFIDARRAAEHVVLEQHPVLRMD